MAIKTLEEHKRETAESDGEVESVEQEITEEAEPEEEVSEESEQEPETESEEAEEDGESEESEQVETWMQSDDQASQDNDEAVPLTSHIDMRQKLKGKIKDQESEIDKLRRELDELRSGSSNPAPRQQEIKKPTREQFDYDDEKYEAALLDYVEKSVERKLSDTESKKAQEQKQQALQQQTEKAVESHYQRASDLVNSGVVSADNYTKADIAFRQSLERVFPGNGDAMADQVIARLSELGEGGEKVTYKLGVDANARSAFESKLQSDPSGLTAMAYLGSLQSTINQAKAQKRVSSAPKPGKQVKGDSSASIAGLKRKYEAAHKAGDAQKALDIKRKAKAMGENTRNW